MLELPTCVPPDAVTEFAVFDLTGDIPSKAFTLQAEDGRPARLVVDLLSTIASTPAQQSAAPSTSAPEPVSAPAESKAVAPASQPQGPLRDIIVAIDPGHGGKDPGALGRGGGRDTHVVLEIANRLQAAFDASPGCQGVLTRSGDTFIPLRGALKLPVKKMLTSLSACMRIPFQKTAGSTAVVYMH